MDEPADMTGAATASWDPVDRRRAHELVVARVEDQILDGVLAVGDVLPPERDLAARLGVSRAAVREAIRMLEAQGVLRSAVGAGSGAGTFVTSTSSDALSRMLRLHVALASFDADEVVETRVMLERWSAGLAAGHATPQQRDAIAEPLHAMDEVTLSRERFAALDTAFHVRIAEAGGNRLVADMTIAIRESVRRTLQAAMAAVADWDALAATLRAEHHAIFDAIAAGDGACASDLMEQHIRTAARILTAAAG